MARVRNTADAIISGAYATDRAEALLDLTYGGQFGYAPELSEWVSSQAYVRRNLFAFLLEAPKFFQFMPDESKWYSSLKALVELHPQSIDGLSSGLEVQFMDHPIGGGGEVMEEPVNVTRAKSNITFNYGPDKYGMPITTFIYNWISYGMMDVDTKYALAGTLEKNQEGQEGAATDWLADWYTMTCLFVEPDPQHKRVLKSWLVTNMMPRRTPEITGKRDLTNPMETTEANIEFTGIVQYSLGVNILAQGILTAINKNMGNANPYLRQAFLNEQADRGYVDSAAPSTFHYDGNIPGELDNITNPSANATYGGRKGIGYAPGIYTLRDSANESHSNMGTARTR